MLDTLLKAFQKAVPIPAMRETFAGPLAERAEPPLAGLVKAWPDLGPVPRRNVLRFLLLTGNRFALAAFSTLFLREEAREPFYEVLSEAGLLGVSAAIDIRRRIPDAEVEKYSAVLQRLYQILKDDGYFDNLKEFLDHSEEKVILYALRQFWLFPTREVLAFLRPIASHANWLVRNNILEIFLRTNTPEAMHAALDFLDDPEKSIREKLRLAIHADLRRFYPIVIERFENTLDLKFNAILSLLNEIGQFDCMEQLVHYVVDYKRPLNVRAFDTMQHLIRRELAGFTATFNPDGKHRRIAIHLRTVLLSGSAEVHAPLAGLLKQLGSGGLSILLREYDLSGSLEAENAASVYLALRDTDPAAELLDFIGRGNEFETGNLLQLQLRKLGAGPFVAMVFKFVETLPAEQLARVLDEIHRVFPDLKPLHDKLFLLVDNLEALDKRMVLLRFLGRVGDAKLLGNLERELEHENAETRIEIIGMLGRFNNVEAVGVLKKVIGDRRPEVRHALLDALMQIDNLEATVLLFYVFREDIEAGDESVAQLIAEKGKERYFKYLDGMDEFMKKELGLTLANLNVEFVDDVAVNLKSLNFEERTRALELLTLVAENRKDEVLQKLRELLNDPDDRMRAMLSKTIASIGGNEVVDLALSLLNDDSPRVRANAIEILPMIHDQDIYRHVYKFLKDDNNRVRANAVMVLYRSGDRRVVIALADMLKSDDKWMRSSAAYALGEIEDERTVPLLIGILGDPDLDVRRNAVRGLGKVGNANCIKNLIAFLSQHDKSLYDEASRAIAKIREREAK